jgi:hypothetical protein
MEKFQMLGESQLGNVAFATPALCGGRIYHRVATEQGEQRTETLYCIE